MNIIGIDPGIVNLSFCVLKVEEEGEVKIVDWRVIDLSKKTSVSKSSKTSRTRKKKKTNFRDIHDVYLKELPTVFPDDMMKNLDFVIIENQPAGKMGSFHMNLFSHLLMLHFKRFQLERRKKTEKHEFNDTLKENTLHLKENVLFASASSKYDEKLLKLINLPKQKRTYHQRKKTSVVLMRHMLSYCNFSVRHLDCVYESTEDFLDYYKFSKKQKLDDLADSFLLAFSFALRNKCMSLDKFLVHTFAGVSSIHKVAVKRHIEGDCENVIRKKHCLSDAKMSKKSGFMKRIYVDEKKFLKKKKEENEEDNEEENEADKLMKHIHESIRFYEQDLQGKCVDQAELIERCGKELTHAILVNDDWKASIRKWIFLLHENMHFIDPMHHSSIEELDCVVETTIMEMGLV
jgi:hypothetical protein